MKTYELRHNGFDYRITTADGVIYDINCDLFSDGHYVTMADQTTLQESNEYSDDINAVKRLVKNLIKADKAKEKSSIISNMNKLGKDMGNRRKEFLLDNRIYLVMKENNIIMNQFINLAIAEKLERDGLLTDLSDTDI